MVVAIEKSDLSDICAGFKVPGDIPTEIDQVTATYNYGKIIGSWLNV